MDIPLTASEARCNLNPVPPSALAGCPIKLSRRIGTEFYSVPMQRIAPAVFDEHRSISMEQNYQNGERINSVPDS